MSEKSKGTLCGIVAAVSYGMNPLGALSLYRAGINTNSVLFYRYALAAVLLAALLLVQKTSLRITRRRCLDERLGRPDPTQFLRGGRLPHA